MAATSAPAAADPINLFKDISGEDPEVTEMESLCMNCHENGTTRLITVKIPFFKEVIVSSFSCPLCYYTNSSAMEGEQIQEKGIEYQLRVKESREHTRNVHQYFLRGVNTDLNRTVVMSEMAGLKIPELDFEAPYRRQSFGITTVEGVISRVKDMLEKYLEARQKTESEEELAHLKAFIPKMAALLECSAPFTLIIDDPSGNSFIENINAPSIDPELNSIEYTRTAEQDQVCGLEHVEAEEVENVNEEVHVFPATCYNCASDCETHMKTVQVPHFNELLLMSTSCDKCGWRNNEAKPSGGIADFGIRITLKISTEEDLTRDVIKSASCSLSIPELEFEMLASDHSSRYTTIEGLLSNIKDLVNKNPFVHGDSAQTVTRNKFDEFVRRLCEVKSAKTEAHLILDDPAGNSFIQSLVSLDQDTRLKVEKYERSSDQDEELGITDMKTENYGHALA